MNIPAIKSSKNSAGYTLVEMALVFLIIGVLIVAILGTRQIVHLARLRKIATETQSYGIAARTFEQKYDALPGDFADAGTQLPGCDVTGVSNGNPYGVAANPNHCRNGNGDGRIGRYCHFLWSGCGQTGRGIPGSDPDGRPVSRSEAEETTQFWKHLFLAGLIRGGIDPLYNPASDPHWQISHPESAVWEAGYTISGQTAFIGGSVVVNFYPFPEYVNASTPVPPDTTLANQMLSLSDAHYIDEKYDNGGPGSGAVWWGPLPTSASDTSGCRHNDGDKQDTWETTDVGLKKCTFAWTVF